MYGNVVSGNQNALEQSTAFFESGLYGNVMIGKPIALEQSTAFIDTGLYGDVMTGNQFAFEHSNHEAPVAPLAQVVFDELYRRMMKMIKMIIMMMLLLMMMLMVLIGDISASTCVVFHQVSYDLTGSW